MGNLVYGESKVYVKDIICKDTIWYEFGDLFAKYMGISAISVGIRMTAAYVAYLGKNDTLRKQFIIDYDSVKDIELSFLYDYFEKRFKSKRLNSLYILKLEKVLAGRVINEIFIEDDGSMWVPVDDYYFEISVLEFEPSIILDNTPKYDLSKYSPKPQITPTASNNRKTVTYQRMHQPKNFEELQNNYSNNLTNYRPVFEGTGRLRCQYEPIPGASDVPGVGSDSDSGSDSGRVSGVTVYTVGTGVIKKEKDVYYMDTVYHCVAQKIRVLQNHVSFRSFWPNYKLVSISFDHPWLSDTYKFTTVDPTQSFKYDEFWDYRVLFKMDSKVIDDRDLLNSGVVGPYLAPETKTTSVAFGLLYPMQDYIREHDLPSHSNLPKNPKYGKEEKKEEVKLEVTALEVGCHDGKCILGLSGSDSYCPSAGIIGKQHGLVTLFGVELSVMILVVPQEEAKRVNDETGTTRDPKIYEKSFEEMFYFGMLSMLNNDNYSVFDMNGIKNICTAILNFILTKVSVDGAIYKLVNSFKNGELTIKQAIYQAIGEASKFGKKQIADLGERSLMHYFLVEIFNVPRFLEPFEAFANVREES